MINLIIVLIMIYLNLILMSLKKNQIININKLINRLKLKRILYSKLINKIIFDKNYKLNKIMLI